MGRRPEMGKWLLYCFFRRHTTIRKYLPETRRYSSESFSQMLNKYRMVYVKPVGGSQGFGIIKVWIRSSGQIAVKKTIYPTETYSTVKAAEARVNHLRDGKACIVQQGIHLGRVNGRPFDVRVMMQRERPFGAWSYTAMCAKVAGKSSVVTNAALSRGTVINVEQALEQGFHWKQPRIRTCIDEMIRLGYMSANHFDTYQFYRELGLDVAVDRYGKVWLIEQNTLPSHVLFAKNRSDNQGYRKIQMRWGTYQRLLGRKNK